MIMLIHNHTSALYWWRYFATTFCVFDRFFCCLVSDSVLSLSVATGS